MIRPRMCATCKVVQIGTLIDDEPVYATSIWDVHCTECAAKIIDESMKEFYRRCEQPDCPGFGKHPAHVANPFRRNIA